MTVAAGFIGFHLCMKLINKGFKVIGIDNLNNYYNSLSSKNFRIKENPKSYKKIIFF